MLHNICIDANDDVPLDTDSGDDEEDSGDDSDNEDEVSARLLRQRGDIKRSDVCAAMQ